MDNSLYITLSKQMALFQDMDITSNNIANTNTTGYNGEHVLFSSYLTKDVNSGTRNPMSMAYDVNSYRDTTQGAIHTTGNPLDIAIQGPGYFTVETPLGNRYTKNGNLNISPEGVLVTSDGYPVLDSSSKQIELPEDTISVDIGKAGNIKVNGEDFSSIGVVSFANEKLLQRAGGNLYSSDSEPDAADETTVQVIQGSLESSNIQPVRELTHMMTVSRAVTDTAQFIAMVYDLERKASDAWAQQ